MSARVLLLCIDGFPARKVSRELTPNLLRLAAGGGWAPTGGRAELPASTYPNHATLLTGVSVRDHGVTPLRADGGDVVPPVLRQVCRPTLFDAARAAALRTRAVVGDQQLVHVLRLAGGVGEVWPGPGDLSGLARCEHGYLRDTETLPRLIDAMASGADFVFGQLNECDTAGHVYGPDSEPAARRYRAADAAVGELAAAAADDWGETLVVVVSDHDMEPVTEAPPIDPELALPDLVEAVLSDGGAAWLWPKGDAEAARRAVAALPGIETCELFGDGLLLAVATPGGRFPGSHWPGGGYHGGAGTTATLAVVGGGHPAAAELGRWIAGEPPPLGSWAPAIASVLGLPFGAVERVNAARSCELPEALS